MDTDIDTLMIGPPIVDTENESRIPDRVISTYKPISGFENDHTIGNIHDIINNRDLKLDIGFFEIDPALENKYNIFASNSDQVDIYYSNQPDHSSTVSNNQMGGTILYNNNILYNIYRGIDFETVQLPQKVGTMDPFHRNLAL